MPTLGERTLVDILEQAQAKRRRQRILILIGFIIAAAAVKYLLT